MASLEMLKKEAVSGVPWRSVLVAPTGLKLEGGLAFVKVGFVLVGDLPEDGVFHVGGRVFILLLLRELEDLLSQPGDIIAVRLHGAGFAAVQVEVEEPPRLACLKQLVLLHRVALFQLG